MCTIFYICLFSLTAASWMPRRREQYVSLAPLIAAAFADGRTDSGVIGMSNRISIDLSID